MTIVDDLGGWQRRFYACPRVWIVTDRDGVIEGAYETEAAAMLSVEWHQKRGHKMRVNGEPICTMELS